MQSDARGFCVALVTLALNSRDGATFAFVGQYLQLFRPSAGSGAKSLLKVVASRQLKTACVETDERPLIEISVESCIFLTLSFVSGRSTP